MLRFNDAKISKNISEFSHEEENDAICHNYNNNDTKDSIVCVTF